MQDEHRLCFFFRDLKEYEEYFDNPAPYHEYIFERIRNSAPAAVQAHVIDTSVLRSEVLSWTPKLVALTADITELKNRMDGIDYLTDYVPEGKCSTLPSK